MSVVSHFSNFSAGGNLQPGDIIVGLRGGVNFQFNYPGLPTETWVNISISQTLAVNTGYYYTGGAPANLLLPPASIVGDIIQIVNFSPSTFTITQNVNQSITVGNQTTTVGVGGSLACTQPGDSIYLLCVVVNSDWISVGAPQGIWIGT